MPAEIKVIMSLSEARELSDILTSCAGLLCNLSGNRNSTDDELRAIDRMYERLLACIDKDILKNIF